MRVFVAGAGGAVGRRLVPALVRAGHAVVGMTRSADKLEAIRVAGAEAVAADALDREAVVAAVRRAGPEVIVHQLTALPPQLDPRQFDRQFALTNRLRTAGTDHLVAAARAAGARRLVAQSFAGWPYARVGGPVKTEDDPLDPYPPAALRRSLEAIQHLEAAVTGAGGIDGLVLRYGAFYGAGSALGEGGAMLDLVRRRRFPIVGKGSGVWSFVHLDDVARATVAAVERGAPGVYNVVDDDPAPVSEWLPALAAGAAAKPPWRVPAWLGRLLAGEVAVMLMNDVRGSANAKSKRELGWQPAWASWRQGFRVGLAG